ncbi:hypothetical protein C8R43DRAFT_1023357 [Mycena crocata]|nr:hypothetical protein C8R43DRAFT_1023357 [Mycena crocata]
MTILSSLRVSIPPLSATPTAVFTPVSAPPTLATVAPPTTVIVTSTLAPSPLTPATTSSPALITATAVILTTTQVTTIPGPLPSTPRGTVIETPSILTSIVQPATTNVASHPLKSSSFPKSSAVRATASATHSSSPTARKAKSNVGKYVGYAIGAGAPIFSSNLIIVITVPLVFFLTLISSFFSAYRKHRKYVRKRPRGSIFIGGRLSAGQNSPQKRSMAQALMRSVSNSSFDAYALSNSPPTSPAPVFLGGSQHSQPDMLYRARGFSPSSTIRPLPATPSPKYTIHEDDAVFYPHVPPVDPHEYSPFGVSSSGSSTQTSTDPRWQLGDMK